jgi:hypothetical protein
LNDIEPESYLRELICLLPDWPKSRVLDLSHPANWKQTPQHPEAQQLLADNIWLFALREIDAFRARSA